MSMQCSAHKGQKVGAKLEGLQLAVTSLCVILCSKDSGLIKQLQEALVFLVFPVTPFE